MTRLVCQTIALVLLAAAVPWEGTQAAERDETTREKILKSVVAQRAVLDSGFHVRYYVMQKLLKSGVSLDDSIRLQVGNDIKFIPFWRAEHGYRHTQRYHILTSSPTASVKEDPGIRTRVYDGKRGFCVTHLNGMVEVCQGKPLDRSLQDTLPEEELYREVIGFESLRQDFGMTMKGYKSPYPWDLVEVLKDEEYRLGAAPPNARNGGDVLLLERPDLDRLWLDAAHGYAIVRRERRFGVGKPLSYVIANSAFADLGRGVWLPRVSKIGYYSSAFAPNQAIVEATLKVDYLSLAPPDDLFKVNLKPGTFVVDPAHGWSGRMPPLNDVSLDAFLRSPQMAAAGTMHPSRWRPVLIVGNVLLLFAVAVIFVWRRRRRRFLQTH